MKLKFKHQEFQSKAVQAVIDCFKGQPPGQGIRYRLDPGFQKQGNLLYDQPGFRNSEIVLNEAQILENIQNVQKRENLPISSSLIKDSISLINLDIEMETGTGKTYCYIKTIFEMNQQFGWNKFIIVVPSIAIREGVYKSFEITAEHFLEDYGKKIKFFIYNSKQLHNLESFSSDAGINVMIINVQAFAARGKDAKRIYQELDDFQSRRPIDVIKVNHPILILDEPQKMEGNITLNSFKEFHPMMILRYSATHRTIHNKIHRLDALDAYNQKLVKKIAVRGITVKGLSGTNAYLYLESIEVSKKSPVARIEIEMKQQSGAIVRKTRRLGKGVNLYDLSGGLDEYKGLVIAEINAITDTVSFTNGVELSAGEAVGNINETALRRIQIREAIKAHFEKEQVLFQKGIKVLTLFFIDEVAKYRVYTEAGEEGGLYAKIFEEEYIDAFNSFGFLDKPEYRKHLDNISVDRTHNGYFSIDKKTKHLVDPKTQRRTMETDDVDAYDLILKDKERLLSFEEPTRFIFSHSALREGWDNPNVFVICTLKHSTSIISRRQEVGRGLRISVDEFGERQDDPLTVHQTNVLTVVASESYKDFVSGLQKDISESLSERPRFANVEYFTGKIILTDSGPIEVTEQMAKHIHRYLIKNDYVDDNDNIADSYYEALDKGELTPLPDDLQPHKKQILQLIESVYSDAKFPTIENERKSKINPLNDNFYKKEFKELWDRINKKAVYTVHFDSAELINKCVNALNSHLGVTPMRYTVHRGEQKSKIKHDELKEGESFEIVESSVEFNKKSVHSNVPYDLVGKITEDTQLKRQTISNILLNIEKAVFSQFKTNPESFISESIRLINEQKATMIIERLAYNPISEKHSVDIFTDNQVKRDFRLAGKPLKHHVYDYVITDSKKEREFVEELDVSEEVVVYAKLPKGFFIPTPVGNYNPDWAIAFKQGEVKHIYFVAETKGSMSSMELREVEQTKIECARRFFKDVLNKKNINYPVKYDVVDSYDKLMEIVNQ